MVDPLDDVFGTGRTVGYTPSEDGDDNPAPMRAIEEEAIASDVTLVRREIRAAIEESARQLPDVISLASQMQDPAMFDSATKLAMALGKLSTDLIGIDLKVLQESKKQKGPAEMTPPVATPGGQPATPELPEATTSDILRLIREAEAEAEVQDADFKSST